MWDLFDFNNDGKVSLEEKVIGVQLIEGTFYQGITPAEDSENDASDDDDEFDDEDSEF